MSILTLVRHAQASFFADHYDQLSPLGIRQATRLGEHLVRRKQAFDEVLVGPRRRQQHTAELLAERFQQADLPFPELTACPELDEYDLRGIFLQFAPRLCGSDERFAHLYAAHREGANQLEQMRNFQRMFESLLRAWQADGNEIDDAESWPAFRRRVQAVLSRVTEHPQRNRRVLAVTSGGLIGTAVHLVTGAPDDTALQLNWRIRNASLTEFVYRPGQMTLDVFNNVSHFDEPELLTFR